MRGIVLDFDGVLVQSMERHAEAYRRIAAPYGVVVRDEEVFLREGARSETILRELLEAAGVRLDDPTLARLADAKQRLFLTLGPCPLYPGAEPLVRRLRAAVPRLGLVTGTRRENLERAVPHLLPLFDAVLAQDAYRRDKPDPEPYANAALALGLAPHDCAALENAPRGVTSALAAGYGFAVGITTTIAAARLREVGAHAVAATHEAAADALAAWSAGDDSPQPTRTPSGIGPR